MTIKSGFKIQKLHSFKIKLLAPGSFVRSKNQELGRRKNTHTQKSTITMDLVIAAKMPITLVTIYQSHCVLQVKVKHFHSVTLTIHFVRIECVIAKQRISASMFVHGIFYLLEFFMCDFQPI